MCTITRIRAIRRPPSVQKQDTQILRICVKGNWRSADGANKKGPVELALDRSMTCPSSVDAAYFATPTTSSLNGFGASSAAIPGGVLKPMFTEPVLVPMSFGEKTTPTVQLPPPASVVAPVSEHGIAPALTRVKSIPLTPRLETINDNVWWLFVIVAITGAVVVPAAWMP